MIKKNFMHITYLNSLLLLILSIFSLGAYSSNLSDDARERGINETCYSYLSQIEKTYSLNGLNITFAHPENPSKFPSLHVSSQIYNNGSSSFSATLSPEGDYCYLSITLVTNINNQSCSEIAEKKAESESLQLTNFADGGYLILTPADKSYQTILTSSGETNCTMTESRMLWPGK